MTDPSRILVVEDSPTDRSLILRALQREFPFAHLIVAHEPEEFERQVQACQFEVAILDWHLGWSDGTSLMKTIKTRCPDRPVVMFTGVAQQEEAVEAMKSGLDDFVLKSPAAMARLPRVVRSVLEQAEHRKVVRETERLALVGKLTMAAAHEIYQPLEALRNLLYLASNQRTHQHNDLFQVASAELRRIQEIVNRTLASSHDFPKPVDVFLPHLLNDVIASYAPRFEYAGVKLERCYESTETIRLFPQDIRQLASNFLSNAIDAVPRGGKIVIRVQSSRDWRDLTRPGIRLTIADSGPGMPPEVKKRLFEPFFTTKGERGTGLGLWVSWGIAQKHKGTLSVRTSTRSGKTGTCFSVFLPSKAVAGLEAA